jgi:uncharacterized protein YcfL
MRKNELMLLVFCVLLVGCSSSRKPDRIEVWHTQQVYDEYEVLAGDTVEKVAQKFNMDLDHLVKINNLQEEVVPGQILKVESQGEDTVIVKQIYY